VDEWWAAIMEVHGFPETDLQLVIFPHLFFRRIKELTKDITGLPGQTAADFLSCKSKGFAWTRFQIQITMKAIPRIGWMFFSWLHHHLKIQSGILRH